MSSDFGRPRPITAMTFWEDLIGVKQDVGVWGLEQKSMPLDRGLAEALRLMEERCAAGNKLIFIGNGGSAAIASHQSVDYWKNGGLEAIAFNDASLLTCIGNDFGYEAVFSEPIRRFARPGDVLLAISSSGRSANILQGVQEAKSRECRVITFSGFDEANPLRSMGDLNFYVPSHSYGVVEITHLTLIHAMVEERIAQDQGSTS